MSLKRSNPLLLSYFVGSLLFATPAFAAEAHPPKLMTPTSTTPATAVGPTSDAEATLLFDDSRALVAEKKFANAVPKLERLVDRYPGSAGFTEAHRLLAICYWKLGDSKRAIPPMRAFIDALGRSERAIQARLDLARILVEMNRIQETIATTQEIDAVLKKASGLSRELTSQYSQSSRLLRARAWIANNRIEDAERAMDSVADELQSTPQAPSFIRSELIDLQLAIQLKACDRLSMNDQKPSLDEAQVKNLLERRSICLSEALPRYRDLLKLNDSDGESGAARFSQEGTMALKSSYSALLQACKNPPAPPPTLSGKPRTAEQTRSYVAERQRILNTACTSEFSKHIELLNAFRPSVPEKNRALLDEVREHAQVLRKN